MTAAPTPPSPDDVAALRDRLRALGYLDAPVDRFVLSGARSGAPTRLALTAALRIGMLTGLLLGPAAALGLATRSPGLVTGPRDGLVLAAYLAVPFGVAAAALAGLAVLVASRWQSRTAAVSAGLTVSALCLAYLTLWWRAAVPADALATQALALGVATAIALLVGHAVSVSILAVMIDRGRVSPSAGVPLSSWRVLLPVGTLAVGGALGLLAVLAPAATPATAPPALTVVPTGVRALVLAVDGADPATLDRLRESGALPTFDRLLSGARIPLAVDADRDPARVWTTVATSQPPSRHGIRSLEGRQLAGVEGRVDAGAPGMSLLTAATDLLRLTRPTIATGDQRSVPTFWEVGADAGLRTAVVHWWATWPAGTGPATVLSDRAILRLEQGGALADEIAPAALYDALLASTASRQAQVRQLAGRTLPSGLPADVLSVLSRSAELDATILALAADPALGRQDILAVYLPGLDIAQHALFAGTAATLAPAEAADRVRAIEGYYGFLDQAIAVVLQRIGDQQTAFLVTQPGRLAAPDAEGLLALSGPGAALGDRAAGEGSFGGDIVGATVLRAVGVPVARDLAATSVDGLLAQPLVERFPRREVETYGERATRSARGTGRPLDQEMIERMRSLGYVR